jgi:selenocysteine lyase/cysteine desulfurase
VPSNRLDLSHFKPDFVALSFYKMFGWPTGVGALIARRDALANLERPWFSGGTIVAAFVQREWYQSAPGAAHFEDGTVNFLNLPAVEIGLRLLGRIGMDVIHRHVRSLAGSLLDVLDSLQHSNGSPAACIYGPRKLDLWEKSSIVSPNMSTVALQAYRRTPESATSSTNSGIGGMSIFSICRFIIRVASADMPGIAPIQVAMCMPGFPTVATLIFSKRSFRGT